MSERDDYLSYVGDIAGQAEENLFIDMCKNISETIKELEILLDEDTVYIIKEKFKFKMGINFKEDAE